MSEKESIALEELKVEEKKQPTTKLDELRNQYSWDLCLVCAVGDPNVTMKVPLEKKPGQKRKFESVPQATHYKRETARMVSQLQRADLHVLTYTSVQRDEVYILIGADEYRLTKEAERTEYDLCLDPDAAINYGRQLGVKLAKVTDRADLDGPRITRQNWQNIYGKFINFAAPNEDGSLAEDPRAEIYQRYNEGVNHPSSPFRAVDRIKLTNSIIEAEELLGGAELALRMAEADASSPMRAYFPLHDQAKRDDLEKKWAGYLSLYKQPLNDIRNYYGEQIAIYFAFLAFYSRWLLIPGLLGLAFFVWQLGEQRVAVRGLPVYGVFIMVWATLMLEAWKRREAALSAEWGMTNFLEKETPRPEFVGEWEISPVNGKYEETFPFWERVKRLILSQTVIWSLIVVVLACVIGIFFFRVFLEKRGGSERAGVIAGVVNAIQIQVLNFIYGMVSTKLNDYENHRTETQYESALIAKSFIFKFVNSYNSLFYIAFVKKYDKSVNGCLNNDCLGELQRQLGTIFIAQLVINNLIEVVGPRIKRALKRREESTNTEDVSVKELLKDDSMAAAGKSPAELEYEQQPYDSTFDDFDEIVIQYGYATLFVVSFPIAPLLAFINNILENRVDSYKLLRFHRRPMPKGAVNIGMWYNIFNVVSWFAVVTNIALIIFSTDIFDEWSLTTKFLIFLFFEHVLLIIKAAISQFIPDMGEDTANHLERQKYLVEVLIQGFQDRGEFDFEVDEGSNKV